MHIEKLTINYGMDLKEEQREVENEDGTKRNITVKVPIPGTGTVEEIHVRRLKFRRRAAIFEELKGNMPSDTENIFSSAPIVRQAQFVVEMISESVCNSDGKLLYPIDANGETEIDDWPDLKRNAYSGKIIAFQSPRMEDAAKNSSSTASAAT